MSAIFLSGESSGEEGAASYLLLDVVEGVGRVDSEADQDDMGIGVGERSETVVIFLSSRIPQRQLNVFSINLDICDVVLEDSWDVDLDASRISSGFLEMSVLAPGWQRGSYRRRTEVGWRRPRWFVGSGRQGWIEMPTSGNVPLEKTLQRH